jgi:hypothetical protein
MPKKDEKKYTVGYRKPPCHTRFKPGQSGNAKGRPKKAKTIEDVLHEEFNRFVTIIEGRKRRRLSKLRVVVRQNINNAANGDIRATAMLLKLLGARKSEAGDNLDALIEQFRTRHNRLKSADKNEDHTTDSRQSGNAAETNGLNPPTADSGSTEPTEG